MDYATEETARSIQLAGKRLLCEIPFERNDIEQLRQNLLLKGIQAWDYPTLAAMMTVGIGVYYYNQGDFWGEFPGIDSLVDRSKLGKEFEGFLASHYLETFRSIKDEGGHRYVGPLLAHGGIPQTCLPDFFKLITHYGDREQSGRDLIDDLKLFPARLVQVDKPVQRFLKFGGEVVEDFVSRFLALWQSYERSDMGAKHGLPDRVVEEFLKWWPQNRPPRREHFKRMPRPELRIEPAGPGVFLYLPRCDDHPDIGAEARWHALGKHWAVTRPHEIPVTPSSTLKVSGVGPEYTLECTSDELPILFFDPNFDPNTGSFISEPSLRRLPAKVWALFKGNLEAYPPPNSKEEFSQWPGYQLSVFDLTDKCQLLIGNNTFDVRQQFFHCDADPVVQRVHSRTGTPVFSSLPGIKWEGKANLSLIKDGEPQGNIDIESGELPVLLDKPGDYLIELRGPLGENIRKHFVLIPGLTVLPRPQVMWPNQKTVKWDLSVEAGAIKSGDATPPFTRYDPSLVFEVEYVGYKIDLNAKVSQLRWRLRNLQVGETTEWTAEPLTIWLKDLHQADYPLLECTFGSLGENTEVFLIGKHSTSKLQAKQQKSGGKYSWYIDLRAVRDELEATGKSEEYDLLIRSMNGTEHFRGKVLSARPQWHVQGFSAKWKKKDDQQIVDVSWRENGKPLTDRWLVIIPLWGPWEGAVLQHHFGDNERSGHKWDIPLSDLRPGRYIVKAVHAPWGCDAWGCDDWIEAQAAHERIIDVYRESWPKIFGNQHVNGSVDSYLQSLLAHWYRHELVRHRPPPPSGLTADEIRRFLDGLRLANRLESIKIPKDDSESLNIFCANTMATTEAYASLSELALDDIWQQVLPSPEIITIALNENDKHFVGEVAFQYTKLKTAARHIKPAHRQRVLSGLLGKWHRNLDKAAPPVDEVIFLCEKFRIFEDQSPVWKGEYEKLKSEYQSREAV